MPSIRNRRTLIVSAVLALSLWLGTVITLTLWRYPQFWVEPHERLARAQRLFDDGQHHAALTELDRAIAGDPGNAGYRVFQGYRRLDLTDPVAAERSFRAALQINPSDAEALLGLAAALAQQGRHAEAMAALEQLRLEELAAGQVRRRSQLYASLNAPGPALADLSELLRSGSTEPELLREAATHAFTLQDWPRVMTLTDWLRSGTADDGLRRWAAERRAAALRALGRDEAAFEEYQRAANPDQLEQRAALATQLRRFDEAAVLYEQLSRRDPHEARFRRAYAFALLAAGRRQEAERALRLLVADGGADSAARQAYAWMLNVQHRYAEAWVAIEPLPRPAGDLPLLELQARTALWAGHEWEAMHLLRALLRARPQDAQLWNELAMVSQAAGDDRLAADALASYLRLRSQDATARQRLAEILARSGSSEAALEHYRHLLANDPGNAALATAFGLLHEATGNLHAAKAAYLQALSHAQGPAPELHLRLARLHRWTAEPRAAAGWYERYLRFVEDEHVRRRVVPELAVALLEAGEPDRSLAVLQRIGQGGALDQEALLTAARAATAARRPAVAARFLELLAAERRLSPHEESWLAGQYRAAGQHDAALTAYERAVAAQDPPNPLWLEAIADLRYDRRDYGGALRALQQIGDAHDVTLKLARAAAAGGELQLAEQVYQHYTTAQPDDVDARLEAARFFAATGQSERAIPYYRDVVERRGAQDLRMELARIHLAGREFGRAEGWARQAMAAGENIQDARLALGQALHLQGRSAEAQAVLREGAATGPADPEIAAWRGQVAVALDRHLTAFREFGQAIDRGADRGERIALWMSTAAIKRGDYTRALQAVERAGGLGAEATQMLAARRELDRATGPSVSLPGWVHQDSNGLDVQQAGIGVRFFLPRLRGAVSVTAGSGSLAQRAFRTPYTSTLITLGQVFPVPQLELGGQVGLHEFGRHPDLVSWRGMATWHVTDEARAAIALARHPVLPLVGPAPLRQFNRVRDVRQAGPGFFSDGLQLFAEFLTRPSQQARVVAGLERLRDGNRQTWLYGHYQLNLTSTAEQWAVLRPNVFFETFDRNRQAYFSPQRHLTIGTMLHVVRQYPDWEIELEVNPQLLRTDGAAGWATHGLLNLTRQIGRTTLSGGTFIFYDALEGYLQWRVGGQLTVPVGR